METTSSIFCPNDWKIKWLFLFIGSIQIGLIASLLNDSANPFLSFNKLLLGFFYALVVPGVLILRSLRLHNLGASRTLIYIVTSSLAFDMFLGFIFNSLLPLIGITKPLSVLPLVVTFGITILLLSTLVYHRDRSYGFPVCHQFDLSLAWRVLFFLFLPLLAVLGAELVNSENNNTVLLILILLLALIPLIALSSNLIPKELYPLTILTVALSIMLHVTLISSYIFGRDILVEFLIFQVTEKQSLWTSVYPYFGYNSTLSITILPTVLSRFTGVDGALILKVAIPLFFCLTPLIIYEILLHFLNRKIALLASFLPMFLYQFSNVMPQTAKNEMGWLFISALFLTFLVQPKLTGHKILIIMFLLAGVLSHYYTAYLVCFIFLVAMLVQFLERRTLRNDFYIVLPLVLFLTIVWYRFTTLGLNLTILVSVVTDFIKSLATGYSSATGAYGLNLLGRQELSLARLILKYLYLSLQVFIALGFAVYFIRWVRRKQIEFSQNFMALAQAPAILLFGVVIPGIAAYIDISRSFSLTMIFLVPFAIAGIFILSGLAYRVVRICRKPVKEELTAIRKLLFGALPVLSLEQPVGIRYLALGFMAIFTSCFLLFGSGWVSEIAKDDYPLSWALSRDRIHFPVYYTSELSGTSWLTEHRDKERNIYYDYSAELSFLLYTPVEQFTYGHRSIGQVLVLYQESADELSLESLESNSYIYLRRINLHSRELAVMVITHKFLTVPKVISFEELPDYEQAIDGASVIFSNGGSKVLITQ